jgi:septum formation protein
LRFSVELSAWYDATPDDEEKRKHSGLLRVNKWQHPLILASGSPRRAELLAAAGIDATLLPPTIDDGVYTSGTMAVEDWVTTLAAMKAHNVLEIASVEEGTVLGADTVCVVDDTVLGQPADAKEARVMLASMVARSHAVYTGWYLVAVVDQQHAFGCEVVTVTMGHIDDDEIDRYISTQLWQGKAGAYNLAERVDAGWSISCEGDPTSVMGLPMERLTRELDWTTE